MYDENYKVVKDFIDWCNYKEIIECLSYYNNFDNIYKDYCKESKEELDNELTLNVKLKNIIHNEKAVDFFGLNPYCLNEGLGTGEEIYTLPVSKAKEFGLI
jgi:hypothetical protein